MSNDLKNHIHNALDAILSALAGLGGIPCQAPDEALDGALRADSNHQAARAEWRVALQALLDLADDPAMRVAVLTLEATGNHMITTSAEVGWRLGLRCHLPEQTTPSPTSTA